MNSDSQSMERSRLWKKLGDDFRRACVLRREGKQTEANEILDQQLPGTIAAWARVSGLREPERRQRLNELFEREQARVEDIWLTQQIILRQLHDIVIPSLCLQVSEEVREVVEMQFAHLAGELVRPAEPAREIAPATAPRVVPLAIPGPVVRGPGRRQPSFDDLPAIIDELIDSELAVTAPAGARVALV